MPTRWTLTSAIRAADRCTSAALRHPASACCRSSLEGTSTPEPRQTAAAHRKPGAEATGHDQHETRHQRTMPVRRPPPAALTQHLPTGSQEQKRLDTISMRRVTNAQCRSAGRHRPLSPNTCPQEARSGSDWTCGTFDRITTQRQDATHPRQGKSDTMSELSVKLATLVSSVSLPSVASVAWSAAVGRLPVAAASASRHQQVAASTLWSSASRSARWTTARQAMSCCSWVERSATTNCRSASPRPYRRRQRSASRLQRAKPRRACRA